MTDDRTPNILFIFNDQQRLSAVGCYGPALCRTPHIDRLATAQPRLFEAAAPSCLPRDVGFDGQNFPGQVNGGYGYREYHDHLRSLDLRDRFGESDQPFFIGHDFWSPHAPHVAPTECLQMYRDVEIPTWPNVDWPSRRIMGPHQLKIAPGHDGTEWPRWQEMIRHSYACTTFIDAHGSLREIDTIRQVSQMPPHLHETAWVADRSRAFLERRDRNSPFFLWSSFVNPHPPFEAPTPRRWTGRLGGASANASGRPTPMRG